MEVTRAMLEGLTRSSNSSEGPSPPLAEAQVMNLREIASRYKECPFVSGDLVTPRKEHNISIAGRPAIVVEVLPPSKVAPLFGGGQLHGTPHEGVMYDMRIITWFNGDYEPYWVESWQFEPYVGEPGKVQQ